MGTIETLVDGIIKKRPFQKKYFCDLVKDIRDEEKKGLENIVRFYEQEGYSIDFQVNSYILFLDETLEETKYFVEYGTYRYSKFKDVAKNVYFDLEYMTKYMIALGLSTYLWHQHLGTMRWFLDKICLQKAESYFEIGPGHGEYFLKAMEKSSIKKYVAVDISEASINLTRKYIEYCLTEKNKKYELFCADFLTTEFENKYDVIVMGEVLEHVENPLALLYKVKKIFSGKGFVYITVPINAPAKDHIYLFRNIESVINIVETAGFEVYEYKCFTSNKRVLEKAIKNKEAILMNLFLK